MTALPAKADLSGTPSRATANAAFGAQHDFLNERLSSGSATAAEKAATRSALEATRTISPIDASVAANALTVAIKPNATEFRSATLTSGAVTILANAADLTLVVPSGATLGSTNGVLTRIAVLEINNAGAKEAAVVNLAGSVNLNEQGVISTTALSTGSDSANVIYSTTARTNVPYRIAGFIEYTQATAGTYATSPSLVNGSSSPLPMWLSGYGQTIQDVLASRAASTDFTNNTGRPITVSIGLIVSGGNNGGILIDGTGFLTAQNNNASTVTFPLVARVRHGSVYRCNLSAGSIAYWNEER